MTYKIQIALMGGHGWADVLGDDGKPYEFESYGNAWLTRDQAYPLSGARIVERE